MMAVKPSFACEKKFRIGGSSMLAQWRLGKKEQRRKLGGAGEVEGQMKLYQRTVSIPRAIVKSDFNF